MKETEYILMDTTLQNAVDSLWDAYELCNTNEDIEWTKRLNNTIERLEVLREEMIYLFKIEEELPTIQDIVRKSNELIKEVGE